jgi:CRP-like cAMP-binding protein
MRDHDSCLVSKLSHYIDLPLSDKALLARLEEATEEYPAGHKVYTTGDPMEHLYVVQVGWFCAHTGLADGGRHVVRIHHPRDVIGFPDLAFRHASVDVVAIDGGRLCPFDKSDLDVVLEEAPRLTALLMALLSRDYVIFIDTLRAISRMHAPARLAFFILDLATRLRIVKPHMGDRFYCPVNQTMTGDVIGLTNVSVSKSWKVLEANGWVEREDNAVIIRDEKALRESCDYVDRYSEMDVDWFPKR